MKKILLATTNQDKFTTVTKILKNTIFKDVECEIGCLKTYNIVLPDEKETGDNIKRATSKAIQAKKYVGDEFDYVVGLDDAIRIKGILDPNVKLLISKILYENYLEENEEYSFNRAYVFIDKENNISKVDAEIPYYYKKCENATIEAFSYPLSKVSCPLGYDKPICELTDEESIEYYVKYVGPTLNKLNLK